MILSIYNLRKNKEICNNWKQFCLFAGKDYKRIERFGRLMDIFIILVAMVLWVQVHKNMKTYF